MIPKIKINSVTERINIPLKQGEKVGMVLYYGNSYVLSLGIYEPLKKAKDDEVELPIEDSDLKFRLVNAYMSSTPIMLDCENILGYTYIVGFEGILI